MVRSIILSIIWSPRSSSSGLVVGALIVIVSSLSGLGYSYYSEGTLNPSVSRQRVLGKSAESSLTVGMLA